MRELQQVSATHAAGARRWRPLIIETLQKTPALSSACAVAKVTPKTFRAHMEKDAEFAELVRDAQERCRDILHEACWNDAVHGHEEPVFQGGGKVGEKRVYSEPMRLAMLKGHIPATFDRATEIE